MTTTTTTDKDQARQRITEMRTQYGDVLNTWPPARQLELLRLQRELRRGWSPSSESSES